MAEPKLGLIGRDRVLTEKVAKDAHKALMFRYSHTALRETRRGSYFDVLLPDGYVIRVTVELDRIDPSITPDPPPERRTRG